MGLMVHPGRRWAGAALVTLLAAVTVGLAGCTDPPAEDTPPAEESVALRVVTVKGAGKLPEQDRTEVETAVGDVLSQYVVGAFLGDFPREEFIGSFESFTSGVARDAAADIDLLTAARVQDAESVRATRLDARVSFLVDKDDVVGATAAVRFEFEATMGDGETQQLSLVGRLMLQEKDGTWSIFGYDVAHGDGQPLGAEEST